MLKIGYQCGWRTDIDIKARCSTDRAFIPVLYNGESIRDQEGQTCDMAVKPIDGVSLTENGMNGEITVIALVASGSMFDAKLFSFFIQSERNNNDLDLIFNIL